MHVVECVIDLVERLSVGDELVHLQATLLPVVYKTRKLRSPFHTSKCAALPDTTGDELERSRRDFGARRCYTNDDGLAPA